MNESETHRSKLLATMTALCALMCAVGYAYAVWFLALCLGGDGSGWDSGDGPPFGFVLIPLTSIAWVFRGTRGGKMLAVLTLAGAAVADAWLIVATASEGLYYLGRVWSAIPFFFFAWLLLWLAWQVVLVLLVFHRAFRFHPEN